MYPRQQTTVVFDDCTINERWHLVHSGKVIPLAEHVKAYEASAQDLRAVNQYSNRALYISGIGHHFGHNLMNETGRLWALQDANVMSGVDAIVIVTNYVTKPTLNVWPPDVWRIPENWLNLTQGAQAIIWMLTLVFAFPLASTKQIVVCSGQTRFNSLSVPARTLHAGWSHEMVNWKLQTTFAQIRDFYCNPLPPSRPRVYISRLQFDTHVREVLSKNPSAKHENLRICNNEKEFEVELEKRGFQILTFENLSAKQQIEISGRSSVLMSLGGSGLHNSCFCQPDGHLISLGDFRWHKANTEPNGNQSLMNSLVPGLRTSFIKMILLDYTDIYYTLNIPATLLKIDELLK